MHFVVLMLDSVKNVMGTIGDGTKRFGSGTADLAKRFGGGTADLARRVGPKRAIIGLAVIGVAVAGSIVLVRYLRSRAEEADELADLGPDERMAAKGRKAKAEPRVSH